MDYVYELAVWNNDRKVRPAHVQERETPESGFESVTLTDEDLMTNSMDAFSPSRLETLVCLFTGHDPAMILHKADARCEHEDESSCNCAPVSIPLPTALALHVHTLSNEVSELRHDFEQWKNGEQFVRRYHDRDGNQGIVRRPPQGYGDSHIEAEWAKAKFLERRTLRKTLDRWFEQGIALHRAWVSR